MRALLFALWFFLPGGLANAAPVFAARLPGLRKWNTPMDFGKKFRGKPMLGSNKTWRGLWSGVLVASLAVGVEHYLYVHSTSVRSVFGTVDYGNVGILWLGPLLGLGVIMGDAIESFFKRQSGVKAGHSWFPFDQTDYIIGGLLLSAVIVRLPLRIYGTILVVWFFLHIVSAYIGYRLGLRERPL